MSNKLFIYLQMAFSQFIKLVTYIIEKKSSLYLLYYILGYIAYKLPSTPSIYRILNYSCSLYFFQLFYLPPSSLIMLLVRGCEQTVENI